jgi:tRNA pseudouridine55 synthase
MTWYNKYSQFNYEKDKEYIAGLRLGVTTDTEDITGTVLTETNDIPDKETVLATAKTFIGDIMQVPPMYSAIKIGGEKLVDLARKGITVEREARPITVYALDIDGNGADYTMRVFCSKGTYIRTLCADIGSKLGCGGIMSSLIRTKTGAFSLENAYTLEAIEAMTPDERSALLLPTETLFEHLPKITLSDFFAGLSRNGCEIYQKKIGSDHPLGTMLRVYDRNGFYAVGEIREYPDGTAVKLLKRFDIAGK